MASLPKAETMGGASAETVEQRFRQLPAIWTEETGFLSSYTDIVEHPTPA